MALGQAFVFSSVIDPMLNLSNHRAKAPIEAAIVESSKGSPRVGRGSFKTGVYAEPWSRETRFSRVDYRREIAAMMSDILGEPIRAENLDKALALQSVSEGEMETGLEAMFEWYDRHSLLGNALPLRAVLEREPRTLRSYLQELAGPR